MRKFYVLLVSALFAFVSHAQVTVSGGTTAAGSYATLSSAVTAINGAPVTGAITVDVVAGHTETLTARIALMATGTATNPIVIQKSGSGANPILTSYTGTSTPNSAVRDGMFSLEGSDYVTIDGIDLLENAANTTETACMEYGYGLFKTSATDGAQNNTIKNCSITLNRVGNTGWSAPGHNGSVGIVVLNGTADAIGILTPTAASGSNSFNKIHSNTIQNCNAGIVFVGFAASSGVGPNPDPATFLGDLGNDVGGSSVATGNNVLNFGGGAGTSASTGIFMNQQWSANVSYNTINNNNGSGVNHTSTLRGIFLNSSSTSASVDCNFNNITIRGGATTSQVALIENSFGGTPAGNTININNNTLTGDYLTATSGSWFGIFNNIAAPATLNINNNSISNVNYSSATLAGSGTVYPIYTGGSNAASTYNIISNTIQNISRTGTTGGTTNGIYAQGGTTGMAINVNNNTISGLSIDGSGTSATMYGIQTPTGTITVNGNSVSNLQCLKSTAISNLYGVYNGGFPVNETVNNNTISQLSHAGSGTVYGIFHNTTSGTRTMSGNTIYNISAAALTVAGIVGASSSPNYFNNKIFNLVSTNSGNATVSGLWISSLGTSGVANVYNNLIGDLRAPNAVSTTSPSVRGINLTTTSTGSLFISNNSVQLSASSAGATFSTAAIYATVSTTSTSSNLTLSNNIFVNNSTPNGATGYAVGYWRSGTALNNFNAASNNNIYYAGTPGVNNLVFYDGTNSDQTLAAYKTRVATAESASATENVPFLSTTGSSTNFLHIDPAVPTQVESGGVSIAGITTDFDGDTRNASTPDIGADEGTFTLLDILPPSISYSALPFTCDGNARTLTATITDASGVPTSGTGLPVLYWNVNGGAYTAATATFVSGNTYSFTFGAGTVLNDVVNYYIVAQDNATTPNVGSFPSTGAAGFTSNPPAAATAPTTPSTYTIRSSLNGIYTVGASGTYATLTAALASYDISCLTGPVTFELIDATYGASETFPITINPHLNASATNTLTIRPAAGVSSTISGNSGASVTALIKLNGADYVTIDGVNTGGASLTIENTSTTGGSAAVWLASSGVDNGATNNTIKNCVIKGGVTQNTSTTTTYGIILAGGTLSSSITSVIAGNDNDNNTLSGNQITKVRYGIVSRGGSTSNANIGNIISGNIIGPAAFGTESVGKGGVVVREEDGIQIINNELRFIGGNYANTSGGSDRVGIAFATNAEWSPTTVLVKNATVTQNKIHDVVDERTFSAVGIVIGGTNGVDATNNLVANNFIYNIKSNGTAGDQAIGIGLSSGVSDKVVYNSIYLTGDTDPNASATSPSVSSFGISLRSTSVSNPQILNNIVFMDLSSSSASSLKHAAINIPSSFVWGVGLSDYNDLYVSTTNTQTNIGCVGGSGGTFASTITDWRAASSQDANSINIAPAFISADDLHLSDGIGDNLCLNGAATSVSGIVTDFDGDARNATTPDIGADEFTPTLPTFLVTNQSACLGSSVDLTAPGVTAGSAAGQTFGYFTDAACTTAVTDPTAVGAGTYYIKATYTSGGCSIDQVTSLTVTNNALPSQFTVTGGGAYCAGGSGVEVGLSGSEVGVNYQLVANGTTNVGTPVAGTGAAISFGAQTTVGSYTVTATNATTGCTSEMLVGGGWSVPSGLSGFNTSGTQTDLSFINQNVGWITDGNSVQKTTDGGITWTTQVTATGTTVLNCVYFLDANNGWAVGSGNVFLRTTDGGTNWTQTALPGFLNSVENYQSIYFTSATNGVMVGYNASYISTDGGATWAKTINSGIKNEVVMTSPTTGYLVGAAGAIQKTTDGGATWTAQSSGTFNTLYDVNFLDDNTGYVVGASGFIAKTTDGGATWVAQTSGTTQTLNSVHFKDVNNGYAAGNGGKVLKTTDGGTTWTTETLSPTTTASFRAIYGSAAGTGVALAYAKIYTLASAVEVSTNPLPTPSITVAETSGLTNNDGTICAGASASLTAAGGSSYSWSGGETTAAITVSPAVTTTYTVTATDANGCQATASTTITVDALPTQYNVTGGGSYCSGGVGVSIGLSGSDVGISYELYESGTATGNIVTGTGSAISFGTITMAGTYTVVASDASTGCSANMIGSETVSVSDVPVINYVLTQPNNCNSNNGGADLTITGAAGPYSFNWTGLGIIQGVEDQSTLRVGSYTVVVTADNGCDATANFTLIGPGGCDVCPTIGAVSTTPTAICQDGTASLSATGLADMGVSYGIDFVVSSSPLANPYTGTVVATVANADLSGGGTGASASYTFTTSGTQYIYAILSPAPADPACRPFQTVQLEVVATPDVNTVPNQTVCSGALTAAVNFSGSVPGTTYNWTNSNPSIGLAASGTGDIASFTATNFTNAPVTSTVTVTPVNVAVLNQVINGTITGTSTLTERMLRDGVPSSCGSPKAFPGVFTTGIFPYTTYTFTNSSGTTQCVSASVVATTNDVFLSAYTNTFTPSNISLNYLADAGSSSTSPTATQGMTFNVPSGTSYVLVLHTTGAPTATFDLTLADGGTVSCPGPSKTFTITVNPTPTVNTVAPVAACNGATVSVPFTGFVPGTVYDWTNDNTAIGLAASGTGDLNFTGTNAGTSPITANIIVTPKYTNDGQTCTGTPVAFTITINPTPTVNAVSNQVACDNGATTAVSFSGAVTGTTYSWTNDTPSIGLAAFGTGDIASFTAVNTGTAPVTATITVTPNYTNGGTTCSGTTTTFTITVNPGAQVNTISNQTVCNGANTTAVNFSTNNTGVTTTYSWTNSDPSIGLAASGTGDIPSFTGINTGTTPVTATVTVTPTYTIPGGTTYTPVSISSPVSYTIWDRQTTYTGVSVNGGSNSATVAPGSTVTLSYQYSVTFPAGGYCPGCIVQNYVGLGGTNQTLNCVNGIMNGSSITRSLTFTAPTTPGIYYIQHGSSLEFNCIPLNWSNNPSGGAYYGNGAAIGSIIVPDVTTCTGTPTTFTFTVNPTPTVNAVSSEVVCNTTSTTAVTFSGAVTGTVYNWTNSNTAIGLAASGTGNIASFTATNSTNAPITATITVTPSYTNGGVTCTGTSTSYTITVNPTPTVNAVSNQTLCNGAATTAVTFSGAVTGTVYTWTNNTTSIGLAASGTGDIASFTATNTTNAPVTATITVTPSFLNGGTLCTGTPTTFTITVNPTPNAVATPAAQTICSANAITGIVLTGNVTGTTYSWTRDNTTAVTGIAASGTGDITGTLTNTTNAPVTVTFTITPTANGCAGTPITATVLVNPTPNAVATPAAQTICSGSAVTTIVLTGNVAGTTYSWTRDNTTAVTGIAASGSGNITGTLTNTTTAPVTVTFTITPTANGCTGAPITATVVVNPIPTVNAVSNQVVCNRSTTTAVAFTGAVTGTVYSWTNNTPSIGLAASGTGNIAAFTAVNTTQAPIVATITVTPSFTNGGVTCTGTPRTFTITVNPTPIVTATDLFNQRICVSDAPIALNATPVGGSWSGIGVSGFNFVPSAAAVGSYVLTYTYTNQYGCTSTDTTTAKVLACDERNRSLEAGGAILYPNPNGGQFNIRVNSTRFQFLQMRIYNALGQLISTKQWNGLTYGQILPVDMRHLPAAVYTVRVIYDGGNLYEDRGYQMLIQH